MTHLSFPAGIRAGLVLWLLFLLSWTLALTLAPPEEPEILAMARDTRSVSNSSHGMSFNVKTCSHCPSFIILERGFGSGIEPPLVLLLTTWSLPAVWAVRGSVPWSYVVEVSPYSFAGALLLESVLIAFVVLSALKAVQAQRSRAM